MMSLYKRYKYNVVTHSILWQSLQVRRAKLNKAYDQPCNSADGVNEAAESGEMPRFSGGDSFVSFKKNTARPLTIRIVRKQK